MKTYINEGNPTTIWMGLTSAAFIRRCGQATSADANSMALVASLMDAGESIIAEEFEAARSAYYRTEVRLLAEFVGPIRLNRHGAIYGNVHPAL